MYNFEDDDNESLQLILNCKLKEDLFGRVKAKTFVETPEFIKCWKELKLTEQDLDKLKELILSGSGSPVDLGSSTYKIRFAPENYSKGKSNAIRTIYVNALVDNYIYLISAFSKTDEDNISEHEENQIRKLAKNLIGSLK